MKLKTLKDIGFFTEAEMNILKQEAINWVKDKCWKECCAKGNFLEFHNITEEDLKS